MANRRSEPGMAGMHAAPATAAPSVSAGRPSGAVRGRSTSGSMRVVVPSGNEQDDATPPPDHAGFERVFELTIASVAKSIERRRKRPA